MALFAQVGVRPRPSIKPPSGTLEADYTHQDVSQLMCKYRCWLFASSISGLARRMYTAVRCTSGRTREEQQVGEPTQIMLLVDANGCSYTRPLVDGVPPSCVSWSRVCSAAGARIQSVCLLACSLAKGHFFPIPRDGGRRQCGEMK